MVAGKQTSLEEPFPPMFFCIGHKSNRLTSLGIDNTGKLVLTYGKEDVDFYVDGDSTSGYIYRAAESTFFCRLRDLFGSEMQAMFVDRENQNAWSSSRLIKQWDDAQNQFPEELWRLDIQRKYLRTYQGVSIDNSLPGEANPRFLTEMMNGRKKYQRRMFERNQELYMATKYFGKTATQDQIMMRFNNPVGASITPDFTLYITPYSDMYIGTSFGNVTPTNFRAKAGIEYTIPCSIESGTADITLIYGASFIQAIGDLSRCYVGDNDFSKASRLQSLVIGSNASGYSNSFMTKISLGNNKLLEYLDIRNVTGLNSVVDLSNCGNLIELHAENSGATGVIFANGGKVEKAYIPAVTSLTVKNLNYLKEFVIENYSKLQTLVIENTSFLDSYNIVNESPMLRVLRLIGINWRIANTDILDRIMTFRGMDNNDKEIISSVLAGNVYADIVKEKLLEDYREQWKDLTIEYGSMINQFAVTFYNYDGSIVDEQYVELGELPEDPLTRDEDRKEIPTKPSTVSHNYTYAGWDKGFTPVYANQSYVAKFSEELRNYTVTFKSMHNTIGDPIVAPYGSYVHYKGDIPKYVGGEAAGQFNLFAGWDKSGYVTGDKVINAVYDTCQYIDGYFNNLELEDMRPVELYALIQLSNLALPPVTINDVVSIGDSIKFRMGHDFEFSDIESEVIVSENEPLVFDGSNYHDTGISLFDVDKNFILAIDYAFGAGNATDATLAQCFADFGGHGFKLYTSGGNPTISWGNSDSIVTSNTNREMIVIRHIAGETGIHVYNSNLSGDSTYVELPRDKNTITPDTLIFGCQKNKDGNRYIYENYAKGTIYWAKLWMSDLGDESCRELASYTHEEVASNMEATKVYYLSDEEATRSSMTFISNHALDYKETFREFREDKTGWVNSPINKWLNGRFYQGLPVQIKQLIKKVEVPSLPLSKTFDSPLYSDCYIYIPALYSIASTSVNDSYKAEVPGGKGYANYNNNASLRIRKDSSGVAVRYWTRTPAIDNNVSYFYFIQENGSPYQFITPESVALNIVIEFSI